jgi:hypothetical protein
MVILFQFRGECRALLWQESGRRYVCGLFTHPEHYVRFLPERWRAHFGKFVASRIATEMGCDFSAEVIEEGG